MIHVRTRKSIANYHRAKQLVANGARIEEAISEAGLSTMSWYKWKKLEEKGALPAVETAGDEIPRVKRQYNKRPKFIDLAPQIETSEGMVAIVVCKPELLSTVLKGLNR